MDSVQELLEGGEDGGLRRSRRWRRRGRVHKKLFGRLFEGQSVGGVRGNLGLDLPGQIGDGLFEIGIVTRERECRTVLRESLAQGALPVEHVGESANGREVFRSALEDLFQLALCLVELLQLDERAAKRHARG